MRKPETQSVSKENSAANTKRRAFGTLAAILALITVLGAFPVYAADDVVTAGTTSIEQVKEILNASTYEDYTTKYAEIAKGTDDIVIKGDAYDPELTSAAVTVKSIEGNSNALETPDDGVVAWKFSVAKEGMYNISLNYISDVEKASSIERIVRIDGKIPFKESRYITMTKVWTNLYEDREDGYMWRQDILENDIRPKTAIAPEWRTILLEDSSCFYIDPFEFYLTEGEHVISFEATREMLTVGEIRIFSKGETPTYEEYLKQHASAPKGTDVTKIQAESPIRKSDIVMYPLNDRTSPITEPQDASKVRLNSIGDDKWKQSGQWIRWEIEVENAGMYHIVPRFKQTVSGVYSSRRIRVNGEIPFQEANYLRFIYNDNWQTKPLSDGKYDTNGDGKFDSADGFEFYLQQGVNIIEMEVNLGDMADLLRRVEASLTNMNDMYLQILMITGPTPDQYRDYAFERLIPTVLEGLQKESENLYAISDELVSIIGQRGQNSVILDKIALQMQKMGENTDKIATNLGTFKTNIGSLGSWLLERRDQPLQLDYIQIQPAGDKMPQAEANFFQAFAHEIKAFALSFVTDYSSIGGMEDVSSDKDEIVQAWTGAGASAVGTSTAGRDQAQIIRQMIDDTFTSETGVRVNLKLVAMGTLLPATLSGTGPDVALSMAAGDPVNYAIRGAVVPLNDFEGFDEVVSRFSPSAMIPLTFFNDEEFAKGNPNQVYALPENQTFPMMFYRKDIFANLDLEIPRTWDDLFSIIPDLQKNKMEVGVWPGLGQIMMFMFQKNEPLFVGDGIKINLDSNVALESFRKMTDMYTMYKFPITFDFANRFRTGEMPIGIMDYATYNQLTVFAPEIRGLWEFYPLPGTARPKVEADNGLGYTEFESEGVTMVIDNDSVASVSSVMMMNTAEKRGQTRMENSWKFMSWWTDADSQGRFGTEMVSQMGAAAKQPTANLEALNKMPWPSTDLKNLQAQFAHLEAGPEVPGSYIINRNIEFAWKAVYNDGISPIETVLDYIPEIDKELSRKRGEFGMPVLTSKEAADYNTVK